MSTRARQTPRDTARRSVPGFFLAVGAACLVAAAVGGRLVVGLVTFGILAACSLALVLLGRRSETYQGLTDKEPDERFARIGGRAWAGTGVVLTVGNLCAFIGELASGRSGDPYFWFLATAALAYIAFVTFLSRHT
ncbi:hypothetical protein [Streptantibioticus cattleyicolor]|uniref:DUF2178 domain-containing protein n=1 Tax=Streptantibioticus cattleyicolor (strain ATCC 35852 / DSM 46488 / JCM 4925 / NBRC 14057 / NRRL 8057) TaxID=1003195 RepID=F8JK86_STREN|nr:hypothetical protein [Streptantibioticus cattleyicolor]AEW98554.1 hypothetical protein SCATT_p03610 [Streptantibioticus cattleyicolor NRRL 8057 = DSM 46488]CCB72389.1 membrane protein of unknown function [Streptantibioticus cattleyicolor NRRL 8057 = DSM 46488]